MLDAIRAALLRPRPPSVAPPQTIDHARIVASLKEVAEAAFAHELRSNESESNLANDLDADRMKSAVSAVSAAWQGHVHTTLGADQREVVRRFIDEPGLDIHGILGRRDDENAHSDILRWFFDPAGAPNLAPAALRALIRLIPIAEREKKDVRGRTWDEALSDALRNGTISVRREFVLGTDSIDDASSRDRVDIVIRAPDFTLAIENKVWSHEHDSQTKSYWEQWLGRLTTLRAGFFLSPQGRRAECEDFIPLSYLQLLSCLLANANGTLRRDEEILLASYTKTLAARVLKTEMRALKEGGHHGIE